MGDAISNRSSRELTALGNLFGISLERSLTAEKWPHFSPVLSVAKFS